MRKRNYDKIKRAQIDRCNICGKKEKLTWDHVPPKSCFNSQKIKYNNLFEVNNAKYVESQNGIRYRSICNNCNNNLLGAKYDKEYKRIVDILHSIYITPGEVDQYIEVKEVQVNKLCRAIIGHILTARDKYHNSKTEDSLREYFLDESKLPPKNMKLLYYPYIYNTIMIKRDFCVNKMDNSEYEVPDGVLTCISAFPLAFILQNNGKNNCGLDNLFSYCTNNIDEKINIKVNLLSYLYPNKKKVRHIYWPCNVGDDITETDMLISSDTDENKSIFSKTRVLEKKEAKKLKYDYK